MWQRRRRRRRKRGLKEKGGNGSRKEKQWRRRSQSWEATWRKTVRRWGRWRENTRFMQAVPPRFCQAVSLFDWNSFDLKYTHGWWMFNLYYSLQIIDRMWNPAVNIWPLNWINLWGKRLRASSGSEIWRSVSRPWRAGRKKGTQR